MMKMYTRGARSIIHEGFNSKIRALRKVISKILEQYNTQEKKTRNC